MSSNSTSPNIFSLSMELVFPSTAAKWITLIQLAYGIPSFTLMIVFFLVLGCSKNYQNSFYRLVQLDLLTNILCYLNSWLGMRLEKHPDGVVLLKSIETVLPGVLNITKAGLNYFLHLQFCSSVAMSLHRISSMRFRSSYDKFWSRFYLIYALISIIYSTLPIVAITGNPAKVSIVNGTLTASYDLQAIGTTLFQSTISSVIYFLLISGIGLTTAVFIGRTVKTYNSDDRGLSKKLTRIALTYCSVYTGILLWTIVTSINTLFPFFPPIMVLINGDLMLFASDMMTLSLPYILLAYDANVRRDILKTCSKDKGTNVTQVFVSTSSVNNRT